MGEWQRIVNTTIVNYLRGEEIAIRRNRKLLAMLEKKRRMRFNQSGDGIDWKVRYRRANMVVNNGEQTLDFARVNRHKTAQLDFEGYAIVDSMTKRERLKNRSTQAIVKLYSNQIPMLMEDMRDQFAEELYIDSSASGNSGRMSGIETMMAATQTINLTDGAARTANAADPVGYSDDTYAGLDTDLGSITGGWTSGDIDNTWPFGRGDSGYDFWTPVIVNYTSTAFTGSTWDANAIEATRFGIEAVNSRNLGSDGQVDMVLLDRSLFRRYKDALDSKERIQVSSDLGLRSLGFRDVIEQDGVEISAEYGMPAGVGYGFNLSAMELMSMQDRLFVGEGPMWDSGSRTFRVVVDFLGQMKFKSPRNFFKLVSLA